MRYAMAEAIWPGETCFIVAGGPSLTGFDFARLEGRKVIAINSSVFSCPSAPILFFGDARWWWWNAEKICSGFKGHIFTCSEIDHPRVHNLVKRKPPPFVAEDRGQVSMNHTSLTAAINLAVHFGCQRLVLLGADMQAGADGRAHHHEEHPVAVMPGCWDVQMKDLRSVAASLSDLGVEVINTSMESRIDWWPKKPIEGQL